MNRSIFVLLVAGVLALSACSSGADSSTTTEGSTPTSTAGSGGNGGGVGAGSATLVVGDNTYTFDNYYCFQGAANTGNSRVSFSSGSSGAVDNVRVQLDASIQDKAEGDAMDGDTTIQSITLDDLEDFENPTIGWSAITGFAGPPVWVIEYDGSTVHAEALFDDSTTDDIIEDIPGTLDAVCGS